MRNYFAVSFTPILWTQLILDTKSTQPQAICNGSGRTIAFALNPILESKFCPYSMYIHILQR